MQGGGRRSAGILKALLKERPDVIVFSEFHNNDSGTQLRSKLLGAGYLYQVASGAKGAVNTVLIASKFPCGSQLFPTVEQYPHNVVMAEFPAFNLYGVYLPHKKKHDWLPWFLKRLKNDKPSIIAGDYNTGINFVDQKGKSFWYTEYLEKFGEIGYQDAFRHVHGDAREYSWFSHQGNGFRYDHTYVHDSILPLVTECRYLHSWREEKLSDHSGMLLKLG